jgi:hypothetical protein
LGGGHEKGKRKKGKCKKGRKGREKEESRKKKRKWVVIGYNKCKIGKRKGKNGMIGVKKQCVARERKNIIFRKRGGIKIVLDKNRDL